MIIEYSEKKKNSFYILIYILLLFISISCSLFFSTDMFVSKFSSLFKLFTWIVNAFVVSFLYTNYKRTGNLLDFTNIFIIFLFMFCNGQSFLYSIGIQECDLSLLNVSSKTEMVESTIYFFYSMLFFHIGSLFVPLKKEQYKIENKEIEKKKDYSNAIKNVALLMLIISIIPFGIHLFNNLKYSIIYGYSYLYNNPIQTGNFTAYFSKLFIPSLLLFLYLFKNNKSKSRIITFILIFICVCDLIIGSRGDALSILIVLLLFRDSFVKKYNGTNFFKVIIYAIIISLLIPTILNFRKVENKNVNSFIETTSEVAFGKDNFMIETLSELGYSAHSFILTKRVVPEVQSFKYGESYFASFMMIIPSFLTGGYSFAYNAALDIWLQKIHSMSYGPGFSLLAETYYNFGWNIGIVFFAVFGVMFTKLFHVYSENKTKQEILKLFSLIFLYNSLLLARFPFHSVPRNILYMFVIPYLLIINKRRKGGI